MKLRDLFNRLQKPSRLEIPHGSVIRPRPYFDARTHALPVELPGQVAQPKPVDYDNLPA